MGDIQELQEAIVQGNTAAAESAMERALEDTSASTVLDEAILPAAAEIGHKYETGEFFLTDLMQCGDTMEAVMGPLSSALDDEIDASGAEDERATIVLATVREDVHDIGKNLVRLFLAGNGHNVIDMGVDVPEDEIVDKAVEVDADIIALSALMSITRDNMEDVIEELEDRDLRSEFKVLVGGRPTSAEWAEKIGADGYADDGPQAVGEITRLQTEIKQAGGA